MIRGFSAASSQSQSQGRDSSRLLPGSGGTRSAPMELGVTPDRCLPFRGQAYSGQSSAANSLSSTQPTPAPPLPPPALKLGQGSFKKVCRTEEDGPCPFPGLAPGVLEMRVKEGSKIRNLMGFAMARMQGEGAGVGRAGLRQVIFAGSGRAVTKTITCAEIMKRKVGALHQLTKLRYKGVREVWESHEGEASKMTVHRTVPAISILLSKDPLDPLEPGYQPPETLSALWEDREGADSQQAAGKRPSDPLPPPGQPHAKRLYLGDRGSLCTSTD